MLQLNPFKKAIVHPLKLSLDTIFDRADRNQANELIFEPQRVDKPTETEGIPMPVVPAGSIVLFVFSKVANNLEHWLSYGDVVKEALIEQLRKYKRGGWRIDFVPTELGEKVIARRV